MRRGKAVGEEGFLLSDPRRDRGQKKELFRAKWTVPKVQFNWWQSSFTGV